LGLVVAGGVEGELAEEFAGVVVEDADVASGDEHGDGLLGVAASHADVVQAPGVAEGEFAVGVDLVAAEPVAIDGDGGEAGVGLVRALNASRGVRRLRARWGRRVL
jgi:hypothetical protein